MNLEPVEKIANAVLYEGYLLYPYRPSAVKNQRRFNFGVLVPPSYSAAQAPGTERWQMQTECLVLGSPSATLDVKVRFLHLRERTATGTSWQEAVEREVNAPGLPLSQLLNAPQRVPFSFSALPEEAGERAAVGEVVYRQAALAGALEMQAVDCGSPRAPGRLFKLTVKISNQTSFENDAITTREEALLGSFVSTHTILAVAGSEFVSLLDPPEELREAAAACQNIGAWPVLAGPVPAGPVPAGEEGGRNLMLASPIILYDYPQIAPESAGDLFDGTEIDEILLLRILTLTEEEKREIRGADERARQMLEYAETLPPEQLLKMHGVLRSPRALDAL
ncbi:MAG: hypothetical protein HYR56_13735 [Acidobacteria bacterium]|nr:hypothetical protein [Acidobacteriota bacterium]MBI3423962.1 hypothetical protein [Acidobacteriota bacterium]